MRTQAKISCQLRGLVEPLRTEDLCAKMPGGYRSDARMTLQYLHLPAVMLFTVYVFKLKLYTFDLCQEIVQFVEHYFQGETQLRAKLDISQLNNRLLRPVFQAVRFRDVVL